MVDDALVERVEQAITNVIRLRRRRRMLPFEISDEDLRQECWVRILADLEAFDETRGIPLQAFLHQRAVWAVIETQRRSHAWRKYVRGASPNVPKRVPLQDGTERQKQEPEFPDAPLLLGRVREIAEGLGPKYVLVFDAMMEGHLQKDVALMTGIPAWEVSKMYLRIVEDARALLAP